MEKSSSSRNSATVCGHVNRKQHVEVKGKENLQEKKTWNDSAFLAELHVFTVCAESVFLRRDRSGTKKFLCFSLSVGNMIGLIQFPRKPDLPASKFATVKSFGHVLTKFGCRRICYHSEKNLLIE